MHECDNSVRFQDLARELLRRDPNTRNATPPGSRQSSEAGYLVPGMGREAENGRKGSEDQGSRKHFATNGGRSESCGVQARPSSAPGDGYSSQVKSTPWATSDQVDVPQQRVRPKSTSRAQGHHGNITRWAEYSEHRKPQIMERPLREVDDCFNWDTSENSQAKDAETRFAYGKKLFMQQPHAGEHAPYGRHTDCNTLTSKKVALPVPFGTDKDCFGRPEEAGTDEYRTRGKMLTSGCRMVGGGAPG